MIQRAEALLAQADQLLADHAAARTARDLCVDRLRDGHLLAIEAHVRALVPGLGSAVVVDWLEELAYALETGEVDDLIWQQARTQSASVRHDWLRKHGPRPTVQSDF